MAARISPAIVVVCAPLPRRGIAAPARADVPVTWVAGLDALLARDAALDGTPVALEIEPAWLESRQSLRAALIRARHAAPGLDAAVVRGARFVHHAVLAEEGFRAVVVDGFADVGRAGRRPAPAGWPCRTVAWGLWEMRTCPPRRTGVWSWLPGLPAPSRGGLHVVPVAGDGRDLARVVEWTARGVAAGEAVAVALRDLPAILEGRRPLPLAASVLRAA